jgi:hypothetical protein
VLFIRNWKDEDDGMEDTDKFEYFIKKPLNSILLMSILEHIKKPSQFLKANSRSSRIPLNEQRSTSYELREEDDQSPLQPRNTYQFSSLNLGDSNFGSACLSKFKVLVADDNYFVRRTLVRQLTCMKVSVIECSSGEEVIQTSPPFIY